ncbi:MAG: LysM peptidoglycan-binding domain-containing protein [Dermatophilaceae bacterium]|nr:hypothetical protein [Intrasporangiaceae bacterium]
MIPSNSRYASEGVEVRSVPDREGEPVKAIIPPNWYGRNFEAKRHTVTRGERLDQIAFRYYRDPNMWWVIAVANPEILYPDSIPGGTEVRIPLASSLR